MKKGVKITLITAVVLLLVGGIMTLICLAMGASWNETTIEFHNVLKWEDTDTMDFLDEEIHSLDLDIEAGTLYIQTGDSYMVSVANGRDNMRCEVKNGVLVVEETDSLQTLFGLGREGSVPVITVVVPGDTVMDTIAVAVGAGMIEAETLRTKSLDVDVDAGSFTCQRLQLEGRCEIDVDAGSVSIFDGHIEGGLQADVDAGMICYEGRITGDWNMDCAMGSIEMALIGAEEDYNYQIECDLGNVLVGRQEFSGLSTDRQINHDARYNAQISCDMGNIEITFAKQ